MIKAIIVDIEGTTTSVSFVFDVLFPYFRNNINLLKQRINEPEIKTILDQVKAIILEEENLQIDSQQAIDKLYQWSVEDRKIAPLKSVQGIIWQEGYKNGQLKGHIYDDVPKNLQKWYSQNIKLGVYSSGSSSAQKLLFKYSIFGDLSSLFQWNFDLKIGHKKDMTSYQKISEIIEEKSQNILFLSDIEDELDAAKKAGFQTIQLLREGTKTTHKHQTVANFHDIKI